MKQCKFLLYKTLTIKVKWLSDSKFTFKWFDIKVRSHYSDGLMLTCIVQLVQLLLGIELIILTSHFHFIQYKKNSTKVLKTKLFIKQLEVIFLPLIYVCDGNLPIHSICNIFIILLSYVFYQ